MLRSIACWNVVLLMVSCAAAADKAPAAQGLRADSSLDQILDALHARDKDLNDFDADVRLTETDSVTQASYARSGKVLFQKKSGGDARLRVVFDKKEDKPTADKDEYLLENGWLTERHYRRRSEIRRQVTRPGEKINLLKLGEGPFPLPIGQDKQEVYRLFDVQKIQGDKNDPSGTVHVQLKPKPQTQFARKFLTIDVLVDPSTNMPTRIVTEDRNRTTVRTTELSNLRINPHLENKDFELSKIGDDWYRVEEAYSEQ